VATESDLRDLLRDPEPEGRPAIDLDAVLTRARRRRRPKVVAAQALGSVAAVGALFAGIAAFAPPLQTATMVAEDSAGGTAEYESGPAASDYALRISAEACGQPFVDTGIPGAGTLVIEPLSTEEGTDLAVQVTLRNDGSTPLTGIVSLPRLVLTLDGVVVGYAPPVEAVGMPIALEPGMSTTFDTVVQPYACDPDDPEAPIEELAVLAPGDYEMRPVMSLAPDVGDPADGDTDSAALEPGTIVGMPQPLVIR
jgi:hypothetical protein